MTPTARIINDMFTVGLTDADRNAFSELRSRIPGWSTPLHQLYFKAILAELARSPLKIDRHICICGVYHGLDLAIIADLAARYHADLAFKLTGVDLFSAEPCADWPEEKRLLTWEEAFGCPPPSMEAAARNVPTAELAKSTAEAFLNERADEFGFIYLDTSHDEATVRAELKAINAVLFGGLIGGDDYTDGGGGFDCGVARAVDALLPQHNVIANRLWIA